MNVGKVYLGSLKTKKSASELISFLEYLIFVLIIFFALIFFIRNSSTGNLLKEQILAKEIALLVNIAKPETLITIEKGNFTVTIEGDRVLVKAKPENHGYWYDLSSNYKISVQSKENKLIIRIYS